jgi:clan AA aspartic protease
MATLRGSLDSSYSPLVAIAVSAPSGPSQFVDAVIDTGFTGFVQLPERRARELGLTLRAVSEAQYADGRIGVIPLAWAKVTLGPDVREGFIHIQSGSDEAIIGVELLRIFRTVFVLSIVDDLVLLVDSLSDVPPLPE